MISDTPGDSAYVIRQGAVKVHVEQEDGRDVIVAILGPGEIVGEMSVVDRETRSGSVVTLEESVAVLDRSRGAPELLADDAEADAQPDRDPLAAPADATSGSRRWRRWMCTAGSLTICWCWPRSTASARARRHPYPDPPDPE